MFCIQCLDHDEGSGAMWHEILGTRHDTREETREHLKRIRAKDDDYCSYSYRIVEVGSDIYYSQPTDALEY